jgi:hypothetical protein
MQERKWPTEELIESCADALKARLPEGYSAEQVYEDIDGVEFEVMDACGGFCGALYVDNRGSSDAGLAIWDQGTYWVAPSCEIFALVEKVTVGEAVDRLVKALVENEAETITL